MRMRFAAFFSLLIVLTGCLPDQSKEVTACVMEAERFYHMYNAVDPEKPEQQIFNFVHGR